jgi:hypothetical protein
VIRSARIIDALSSFLAVVYQRKSRSFGGGDEKCGLGFAGPLIYQLANGGPTPSSPYFNDVILGANGYGVALPGYDYTTGLGSWDIYVVNQEIPSTYPN